MSTSRSGKIEQLFKSLRKHYKTVSVASERTVMDHLVYGCILEDTTFEQADEGFAKILQMYVDYNEIRVTTAIELSELIAAGPVSVGCAQRLKRILQSIYETRYGFDVEDLKKGNLAKSVEFLTGLKGMTNFVSNYVSQNAFGGHSIPVGAAELQVALVTELITDAELKKGSIPGLERTIPKSKGIEFGQLLHQLAVDFRNNPKSAEVAAIFKELKITYKPAAPAKPEKVEAPAKSEKASKATEVKAGSNTPTGKKEADQAAATAKVVPASKSPAPASGKDGGKAAGVEKSADTPAKKGKPAKPEAATPVKAEPSSKTAKKKPDTPATPAKTSKPSKEKAASDKGKAEKSTGLTKGKSASQTPSTPKTAKKAPAKKEPASSKKSTAKPSKTAQSLTKKKPR